MFNFFKSKRFSEKKCDTQASTLEEVNSLDPIVSENPPQITELEQEIKLDPKLESILKIAPYIKSLLGEAIGFYVSDATHMKYAHHGDVNLNMKPGNRVSRGSVTDITLKNAERVVARVGKEAFGIAYIGTGYPIKNSDNEVIGAMVTVTPITLQESLSTSSKILEETVNTIITAVKNLVETSEEMTCTSINLNKSAQNINNEIKKTDEVGVLITEVSDRTHLLGLNAAIEAARAGEQGKGFTIVANEIRKMSIDTKGSVNEITQNLKEMKNSIAELTSAFEQIASTSEHQSTSTQAISSAIENLMELAGELKKDADKLLSE